MNANTIYNLNSKFNDDNVLRKKLNNTNTLLENNVSVLLKEFEVYKNTRNFDEYETCKIRNFIKGKCPAYNSALCGHVLDDCEIIKQQQNYEKTASHELKNKIKKLNKDALFIKLEGIVDAIAKNNFDFEKPAIQIRDVIDEPIEHAQVIANVDDLILAMVNPDTEHSQKGGGGWWDGITHKIKETFTKRNIETIARYLAVLLCGSTSIYLIVVPLLLVLASTVLPPLLGLTIPLLVTSCAILLIDYIHQLSWRVHRFIWSFETPTISNTEIVTKIPPNQLVPVEENTSRYISNKLPNQPPLQITELEKHQNPSKETFYSRLNTAPKERDYFFLDVILCPIEVEIMYSVDGIKIKLSILNFEYGKFSTKQLPGKLEFKFSLPKWDAKNKESVPKTDLVFTRKNKKDIRELYFGDTRKVEDCQVVEYYRSLIFDDDPKSIHKSYDEDKDPVLRFIINKTTINVFKNKDTKFQVSCSAHNMTTEQLQKFPVDNISSYNRFGGATTRKLQSGQYISTENSVIWPIPRPGKKHKYPSKNRKIWIKNKKEYVRLRSESGYIFQKI